MITSINKIRDFGIFEKFDWSMALPLFRRFNVLFGWNYSGKTTISRLFRSLELGRIHQDYSSATFEVEDEQGNRYSESTIDQKIPIRVFNTDFIDDNLKWDSGIEPILILGQPSIELQSELDQKKQALKDKVDERTRLNQKQAEAESGLQSGLTNKARDIKNLLSRPNFTKAHFEPYVVKAAVNIETYRVEDEVVEALITTYKSTDKKPSVEEIAIGQPSIGQFLDQASTCLSKTVEAQVIESLKENPELNEWVRKGRELHVDKTICQFCGNNLPSGLLTRLSHHFSEGYEIIINDIEQQISSINAAKMDLSLPDEAKLYREFQKGYLSKTKVLQEEIKSFNDTLDTISQSLEGKKCSVFDCLEFPKCADNGDRIQALANEVNEIIRRHNKKTQEFDKQKEKAFEKLVMHYAADFAVNQKYSQTQKEMAGYQSRSETLTREIRHTEDRITSIEEKLSETAKGAEKINEYLKLYFGKGDVTVTVTSDNRFQLLRGDLVAKNLSQGEKTAISFAYFITQLDDRKTNLPETIVYIDDPVSSLDSNHLFNTFSFIKTKLSACGQLFVSTHNFEFFNLLKTWLTTGKGMKKSMRSFYMIERLATSDTDQATITEMPKVLLDFHSEYCYLFSLIYKFKEQPTPDYHQLYNLPNIARRFMESLMSFKIPDGTGLEHKIHILIPNEIEAERVRKFVHHYSHSSSVTRSLEFPDLRECIDIIDIVLSSVKNKYQEHYDALVEVVAKGETEEPIAQA